MALGTGACKMQFVLARVINVQYIRQFDRHAIFLSEYLGRLTLRISRLKRDVDIPCSALNLPPDNSISLLRGFSNISGFMKALNRHEDRIIGIGFGFRGFQNAAYDFIQSDNLHGASA